MNSQEKATLVDILMVYGIVNKLSVIIPAPIIVFLANRIGIPVSRTLNPACKLPVVQGRHHLAFNPAAVLVE